MKRILVYIPLLLLIVFSMAVPVQAAEMEDYCVVPPYVKRNLKPNILIIMDNSEIGGQPAYNTGTEDALATGLLRYFGDYGNKDENGDPIEEYPEAPGLFNQKYSYYYDGEFNPVMPGDAPNPEAVFEGNLLNWATTSMYDVIQSILVGGKSASRQVNAHTLISDNSGVWQRKLYHYTGTDDNEYVCEFRVNEGDSGDLEISDSQTYFLNLGLACGLILDPPVGPKPEYTWLGAANNMADDGTAYADASPVMGSEIVSEIKATVGAAEFSKTLRSVIEGKGGASDSRANVETASLKKSSFNLLNSLLGLLATDAYAVADKVVEIITPDVDGATLSNAYAYELFFPYSPQASGGDGDYTWVVTGLPAGMDYNPGTGVIYGTATETGTFTLTFTVTSHLIKSGDETTDTKSASLTLTSRVLEIFLPEEGTPVRDGFRGYPYKFKLIVRGGSGEYLWDVPAAGMLPAGIVLNRNAGILTTVWDPIAQEFLAVEGITQNTTFPLTLTVRDQVTGESDTINTSLTIKMYPLRIINERTLEVLPIAELGKDYSGPTIPASGGHEPYAWSAIGLPGGLYINNDGKIMGTANLDIALVGTYIVEVTVTDMVDGVSDSVTIYMEVVKPDDWDIKITWPDVNLNPAGDVYGTLDSADFGMFSIWGWHQPEEGGYGKAMAVGGGDPMNRIWSIQFPPPTLDYPHDLNDYIGIDPATGIVHTIMNLPPPMVAGDTVVAEATISVFSLENGTTDSVKIAMAFSEPTMGWWINSGWPLKTSPPVGNETTLISETPWFIPSDEGALFMGWDPGTDGMWSGVRGEITSYTSSTEVTLGNITVEWGDPLWEEFALWDWQILVGGTRVSVIYPDQGITFGPDGVQGAIYNGFTITTRGSQNPVHCDIVSGSLPPGLSLTPDMWGWENTCIIEGTVDVFAAPGTYTAEIKVDDWNTWTTAKVSINVLDSEAPRIVNIWDGLVLESAYQGRYYEFQPIVEGGLDPYTWTSDISSVFLNMGLDIDEATGLISGTPISATSGVLRLVTVGVTDAKGKYAQARVRIRIWQEDAISLNLLVPFGTVLPTATVGIQYLDFTVIAQGGIDKNYEYYTRSFVSDPEDYSFPDGMYIDPVSGGIGGVPWDSAEGTKTVRICVRDGVHINTACTLVTMEVAAPGYTMNSQPFNIKVCTSDDYYSCLDAPANYELKEGLLQNYWDQAGFGLLTFTKTDGEPGIDECLPAGNDNNFLASVQNANPSAVITKLVDGEHLGITLFINSSEADNSCPDVFDDDNSPCRNNFILMLTSGDGADNPPDPAGGDPIMFDPLPSVCENLESNLAKNACYGFERDNRPDVEGDQKVSTYIVNIMGTNGEILSEAAANAGGIYYYATNPSKLRSQIEQALKDIIKKATSGTAASVLASGEGSGANIIQAIYYPRKRFKDSQTKMFEEIMWLGKLSGFWYFADPYYVNSDIREESEVTDPAQLNLTEDYIIQSFYNTTSERVEAYRYRDTDGDGSIINDAASAGGGTVDVVDIVAFEDINPLWEAGKMLWQRDLATDPRNIFVNLNDTVAMESFDVTLANGSDIFQGYLGVPGDPVQAENIVKFVQGYDLGALYSRSRKVKVDLDGDGETLSPGETEGRVWKLGDILNSSPTISTSISHGNKYDTNYFDGTYKTYLESDIYKKKGMVYAGGNDGMLHAFKLGYLSQSTEGFVKSKLFTNENFVNLAGDTPLGTEEWAFVPKNVLPYLQYTLRDDYCHIFMVDLTVTIVDVSLCETQATELNPDGNTATASECAGAQDGIKGGDSWRTVLLGGMRFGGSCKPYGYDCAANSIDTNGDGDVDEDDCVVSPIDTVDNIGLSSYFALDITDDQNPKFMWEFSHPDLGYSTVKPTVVRFVETKGDTTTLGQWYAVIGSGPTGPIDKSTNQFVGASDQSLKVFVLDIKTGEPQTITAGKKYIETNIQNSYVMSQGKASADINEDYSTDVIYIGYTSQCTVSPLANGADCPPQAWRDGGILRILTADNMDPANWNASVLIDGVGPVSAAIGKMYDLGSFEEQKPSQERVYFGTGRYLYERVEPWTGFLNAVADDQQGQRTIFGIIDPCSEGGSKLNPFPEPTTCQEKRLYSDINDATLVVDNMPETSWFIDLDPPMTTYDDDIHEYVTFGAERVITDVTADPDVGLLYVTSFKPYADECSIGGETFFWAIDALTGGAPNLFVMKGVAVMQVSTGNIKKIDLSTDFVQAGGRKTDGEVGVSSMDQSQLNAPGASKNRMLHIIERK